jgi:hypothetical protein
MFGTTLELSTLIVVMFGAIVAFATERMSPGGGDILTTF